MRNIKLTCGMLAFSVFLTFTSCQKEDAVVPGMDTTEFSASEYQLADLNSLENPEVTDASETTAFGISDSGRRENTDKKEHDAHSLAFILRQLNLDEAQRKSIKSYVEQQHTCVMEHRAKVQERHQEIVEKANAVREEYVKAYRAGRITKVELEEKLTALRDRLRGQLQNDEHKQVRMRILQKCRTELFGNIASLLTREQLHKFNRWRQSQR